MQKTRDNWRKKAILRVFHGIFAIKTHSQFQPPDARDAATGAILCGHAAGQDRRTS